MASRSSCLIGGPAAPASAIDPDLKARTRPPSPARSRTSCPRRAPRVRPSSPRPRSPPTDRSRAPLVDDLLRAPAALHGHLAVGVTAPTVVDAATALELGRTRAVVVGRRAAAAVGTTAPAAGGADRRAAANESQHQRRSSDPPTHRVHPIRPPWRRRSERTARGDMGRWSRHRCGCDGGLDHARRAPHIARTNTSTCVPGSSAKWIGPHATRSSGSWPGTRTKSTP